MNSINKVNILCHMFGKKVGHILGKYPISVRGESHI